MITPNDHVISQGITSIMIFCGPLHNTLSQLINFPYSLSVIDISQSYHMTLQAGIYLLEVMIDGPILMPHQWWVIELIENRR